MKLSELINKEILSAGDILSIIQQVGENKDAILVKNDRIREENQYTVVIILSRKMEKSFRCDDGSLAKAMKIVLKEYVKEYNL
ncbi:hypothetical protein KTO58_18925 [Chitinophaga pendula]|uniref:hypothetical protein n=1 Tax=Chitinophaga TaxID=79328 RepID=UPI000BAF88B8|nr:MULTISPECIES: hypothetical protein [Chitinophaga]ASZ11253.1 hypothetical protein CK934_09885 [Chitinophaga sp. MD30]UCJ05748.1 hypothetical protein KTO58_18925 [Chitinophaga pendula]